MKQMKQMKQQSGFTLVELVTTMVIVGTLAAVAVPKFADAAKDARITKLESLRGSILSISGSIHNTAMSRGKPDLGPCPGEKMTTDNATTAIATNSQSDTQGGTFCTEGGLISLAKGFPAAGTVPTTTGVTTIANTGIISAAGLTTNFRPSYTEINKLGFGVSVDATGKIVTFSVTGGSGTTGSAGSEVNPNCSFSYTESTGSAVPPVVTVITTTGC